MDRIKLSVYKWYNALEVFADFWLLLPHRCISIIYNKLVKENDKGLYWDYYESKKCLKKFVPGLLKDCVIMDRYLFHSDNLSEPSLYSEGFYKRITANNLFKIFTELDGVTTSISGKDFEDYILQNELYLTEKNFIKLYNEYGAEYQIILLMLYFISDEIGIKTITLDKGIG